MKALDFEFAGRRLRDFDMIICSFGSKGLETISNGSVVTFNTVSILNGSKHNLVSTQYENCLTTTLQICKSSCTSDITEISSTELRELMRWLSQKDFRKFKLLDEDNIDLYHEAVFPNISRIEMDGKTYGLELELITNRPFALKEPKTININLKEVYGWEEYKDGVYVGYTTSTDEYAYPHDGLPMENGSQYIYLEKIYEGCINDTSYEVGYIYPHTEITVNEDGDLKIYNAIENRVTYIANCVAGEVITMDYPIIQSSISSHNIQNNFNWNFFRVANTYDNSRNDLIITLQCAIKIEYSPIVKVGL